MSKKTKIIVILTSLFVLLTAAGYSWYYMVKKEANILINQAEERERGRGIQF